MQPQCLSRQKNISALPLQPNVCDDQVTLCCSPLAVCLTQKMYILVALQSKIRSLLFSEKSYVSKRDLREAVYSLPGDMAFISLGNLRQMLL